MKNKTEKNELPNLWVHHQEEISAGMFNDAIPERYTLSVPSPNNHLYIPAERIRELLQKEYFGDCEDFATAIIHDLEELISTEK